MGKIILTWIHIIFLLSSIFWGAITVQAKSDDDIRVCLSKGSYSAVFRVVQGNYSLQDMGTLLPIIDLKPGDVVTVNQAGKIITVTVNEKQLTGSFTGNVLAAPQDEDSLNVFSYKNTLYRDGISLTIDSGSLLVVNKVNIEHYLYGVVGQEIGYTAPEEALKAQAVVSRTFALFSKGQNIRYDVGSDTYSQVYGGYSAEQNINAGKIINAVNDTKGRVIYYNNEIIQAVFHSNAGGYTENSENVWNEALPYLQAVSSQEDKYAETYSNETGDSWPVTCYRWEKSFSLDQIEEAIRSYNQKTTSPIDIGEFQSINLYRVNRDEVTPTLSGRVTRMELVGSKGKASVYRDNIRSVFDLKSTKFDIVSEGSPTMEYVIKDSNGKKHQAEDIDSLMVIDGQNNLVQVDISQETCQIIGESGKSEQNQAVTEITFIGQGYGHGLGMSQWGARGMALEGYDYREIIDHYYNQGKDDGTISIKRY
ncbi:MAG: SpoIID/LytB domain-containing protein [Dehalobacterium sp.]